MSISRTEEIKTENEVDHKRIHRRKQAIILFSFLFLLIGLIWLIYWLLWGRFEVYTDDAYVNGNLVELMSQVRGTVIEIASDDTFLVKAGQPLIKLDPSDTRIALDHAEASLALTIRKVRQSFENVKKAESTLAVQKASLIKAQLDLKRRQGLVGERAISREEMQHYKTLAENAESEYQYALHQLGAAVALIQDSDLYHHPEVTRAKENVKNAYLNFIRTTIHSPTTGYIAKRSVQIGQNITVETPLLSVVPLDHLWVNANYKESQLNDIRIGQPVVLYADAYPDITYHGKVIGLNAGTGAAFSLLPPQNATGNWIKIVQRLPVRISLDPDELKKHPLQIGLSMRVTIDIHDTKGLRLANQASEKPLYSTSVYANQLENAHQLIESILKDNSQGKNLHG